LTTALDFDEELAIEEGGWRGRLITFGVLLLIGAFAVAGVYYFFLRDSAEIARATEDIPVIKGTIASTLLISGTANTQLNSDLVFQSSGKVSAVSVNVGDTVRQGQVLAALESDDLTNAVASAESNVATAQLKLQDLLDGSSDAELAAANQLVAQSQAAMTKAENDYQQVLDGPTAAELAALDQGVTAAEAQLAAAQSTREKLDNTPSAADLAAAEAGVAAAQSALTAAENSASSAQNSVNSAEASLKSAETSYCDIPPAQTPAFCASGAAPISSGDASILDDALSDPNLSQASVVISANGAYLSAVNTAASAAAAVSSSQDSLASANEKLDLVEAGPSDEDVDASDAAVTSAQAALDAAHAKLTDAQDGPTDLQISTALAGIASARATLESSQARLDEATRGPDQNAIAQAQQGVRSAQLTVEAARIRLKNAQIIAPFDGTVAAVNIAAGEFTSAAAQEPAIVLLTPDRVELEMDVGETDYTSVKVSQGGVVIFDGIAGKPYPFTITNIGLTPTVNQGVVTFPVKASIVILPGNPRPVPGMNGRGQLTTDSKPDILIIPPRAIRRRGTEQVVDVRRGDSIETVVVTTGLTDPEKVEILTGLAEGDKIVVPKLIVGADGPQAQPTLPGGIR
jgi:RND family efflux transporter MFP subunit